MNSNRATESRQTGSKTTGSWYSSRWSPNRVTALKNCSQATTSYHPTRALLCRWTSKRKGSFLNLVLVSRAFKKTTDPTCKSRSAKWWTRALISTSRIPKFLAAFLIRQRSRKSKRAETKNAGLEILSKAFIRAAWLTKSWWLKISFPPMELISWRWRSNLTRRANLLRSTFNRLRILNMRTRRWRNPWSYLSRTISTIAKRTMRPRHIGRNRTTSSKRGWPWCQDRQNSFQLAPTKNQEYQLQKGQTRTYSNLKSTSGLQTEDRKLRINLRNQKSNFTGSKGSDGRMRGSRLSIHASWRRAQRRW